MFVDCAHELDGLMAMSLSFAPKRAIPSLPGRVKTWERLATKFIEKNASQYLTYRPAAEALLSRTPLVQCRRGEV
jgi:hypothetical protein